MSLFGGTGFLGLGGTGVGDTVESIFSGAEKVLESAAKARIELPNKVIDFGKELGNQTFDTSADTAQRFKDEALRFRAQQAGGSIGQGALNIGSFIANNALLIAGAIGAYFLLKK